MINFLSKDSMVSELFSDRVQELATVGEDEIEADRIMEDFQDQQDQVTMHRWDQFYRENLIVNLLAIKIFWHMTFQL